MSLPIEYRDASYPTRMYGKGRVRRVEARLGQFAAFGVNKTEAKAELEKVIADHAEHLYDRDYLTGVALDGAPVTFALYYNQGWCYDIIRSAHRVSSCCGGPEETHREALARVQRHFDQYVGNDVAEAA